MKAQIARAVDGVLRGAKTTVVFLDSKNRIKATLKGKDRKNPEIMLTIGRPNYAERKYLKVLTKAKVPISNELWFPHGDKS